MSGQRCFKHRQSNAFLFQLDDAIQSAEQLEASICFDARRIGGLFDVAWRQARRGDAQCSMLVLAQLHPGEGLPQGAALAPGDATGLGAAVDFGR